VVQQAPVASLLVCHAGVPGTAVHGRAVFALYRGPEIVLQSFETALLAHVPGAENAKEHQANYKKARRWHPTEYKQLPTIF